MAHKTTCRAHQYFPIWHKHLNYPITIVSMMPTIENPHQNLTCYGCICLSTITSGFSELQMRQKAISFYCSIMHSTNCLGCAWSESFNSLVNRKCKSLSRVRREVLKKYKSWSHRIEVPELLLKFSKLVYYSLYTWWSYFTIPTIFCAKVV